MARKREIEIEEFAKEIGRKWYNDGHESVAYASARQGALWADKHPSREVVERVCQLFMEHECIERYDPKAFDFVVDNFNRKEE